MDYRIDYLDNGGMKAATFFRAEDDAEACQKAQAFYRVRGAQNGFELWEGRRLVRREPTVAHP